MILCDYSQIMHAAIGNELGRSKATQVDEGFLRHLILNHLTGLNTRFRGQFGTMLLVMDGKGSPSWRKQKYPVYKAHRKKKRDASIIDWKQIFEITNSIQDDLVSSGIYPMIQESDMEADDVIAFLSHHALLNLQQSVLILSSDKDFRQLQYLNKNFLVPKLYQFSPILSTFLEEADPEQGLFQLVMEGDKGDGVPNVLSPIDTFVSGGKQRPLVKSRLDELHDAFAVNQITEGSRVVGLAVRPTKRSAYVQRVTENDELINLCGHGIEDSELWKARENVVNKFEILRNSFPFSGGTAVLSFLGKHRLVALSARVDSILPSREWFVDLPNGYFSEKKRKPADKPQKIQHERKMSDSKLSSHLDSLLSTTPNQAKEVSLDSFFL